MGIIKNFSLFSNSGIGEYGTNNIQLLFNNEKYKIDTVIANELLEERAEIFRNNYPKTNMICGSITEKEIQSQLIEEFKKEKPITGTFSPPCQGSSGLNAFKSSPFDFRNQLIKSVFKIFQELKDNNSLQLGYIENVVSYYNEKIPALIINNNREELLNDYIITDNGEYLNYEYFILSNEKELKMFDTVVSLKRYTLSENQFYNPFNKKYAFAFNSTDIITNIVEIENIKSIEDILIKPINTFEYIQKSLNKYGYNCELKTIRGEEYGGCQVRQRGFVLFYKDKYDIKFPDTFYKKSTDINYDGKTILDAFKCLDLIKIIDIKDKGKYKKLLDNKPTKIIEDKIFVDMSITEQEAQQELIDWNQNNCPHNKIPNLHFRQDLKDRFRIWLENTKEGTSAYKNEQRIHRPYKIIEITRKNDGTFSKKGNQDFVVEEDTKEYFQENNILDYLDFVSEDMKEREGIKEWGNNGRKWQIKNIADRKLIEERAILKAEDILKKDSSIDSVKIFMPIKGFEAATYKRARLNSVSSALTTKNGIGNSNTCHPIFNRTWTPKEYMAMFGIGYIFENGEYKISKDYIPPKNILKIRTFANLLFEIHGEAIISTVAEQIMKSIVLQYLRQQK